MAETDNSWIGLNEPWQRLAWARARKYSSQSAFNRKLGYPSNAYGFHERDPAESAKATALTLEKAREWGPLLAVRPDWLYDGKGEPWLDEPDNGPRARVLKLMDAASPQQQKRIADAIEALTGTDQ